MAVVLGGESIKMWVRTINEESTNPLGSQFTVNTVADY